MSQMQSNEDIVRERRQEIRLRMGVLSYIFLWCIISGLLLGFSFYVDSETSRYTRYPPYGWLPKLAIVVCTILFNLASADILWHYVRHHRRNVIAWTTAIIVFTPFLTAIAYFLTWPKNQAFTLPTQSTQNRSKQNRYKRERAYRLARYAGLLDRRGEPTDEYISLIKRVTGKDRMATMTDEEADRFLQALESLAEQKSHKKRFLIILEMGLWVIIGLVILFAIIAIFKLSP